MRGSANVTGVSCGATCYCAEPEELLSQLCHSTTQGLNDHSRISVSPPIKQGTGMGIYLFLTTWKWCNVAPCPNGITSLQRTQMFSFFLSVQGLQVDDEIVEFGSVNVHNFQNLQNIATVVQHSEGVSLLLLKQFS